MERSLSLKRSSIILLIGGLALVLSRMINDQEIENFLNGFGCALIGVSLVYMVVGFIRKQTSQKQ